MMHVFSCKFYDPLICRRIFYIPYFMIAAILREKSWSKLTCIIMNAYKRIKNSSLMQISRFIILIRVFFQDMNAENLKDNLKDIFRKNGITYLKLSKSISYF